MMISIWQWILGSAVTAVGALGLIGYLYELNAERRVARECVAPGRMVLVGTRRFHLNCKGTVGPTVVIEQGAGEPARLWWSVQDSVAHFARVCTYDRLGYGWSDSAPAGRGIDDRMEDLHGVLMNARLPPPFVLVAHSYGGFIVRRFAEKYPDLTAGLVLVDTAEEGAFFRPEVLKVYARMRLMLGIIQLAAHLGVLRLLSRRYALDEVGLPFVRAREYAAAADELTSLGTVSAALRAPKAGGMLSDLPLAVITHGLPFPGPLAVVEKGWAEGQRRLAALSTAGTLIVAEKSNHMIQHDEPDLVVEVIRRIHAAAAAKQL